MICWVRIDQRVGYKLIESGYGTSEPGKRAELWSLANFRVPHSQSSARHAYINFFFTRIVVTGMADFTEKQGLLLSSWELPCKIT